MHELFRHRLNLNQHLPDDQIILNWNVTQSDELVVLTISREELEQSRVCFGSHASVSPDKPVLLWRLNQNGVCQCIELKRPGLTCVIPQALSNERFLLVSSRCDLRDEFNAVVIGPTGEAECQFKVGDAVADVQVARRDAVWVSYFDEGALHNRGWNDYWSGLVEFDLKGKVTWKYFSGMTDCYSLNVEKGRVHACYYTDFPVLRVNLKDKSQCRWQNSYRRGCKALAVWGDNVLLAGGYADEFAMASLVSLEKETTSLLSEFSLDLTQEPSLLTGRGPLLHYVTDKDWWTLDIRELT